MKTLNALIRTDNSLTVVIDGVPKTMNSDHYSFDEAISCITEGDIDSLDRLFEVATSIANSFNAVYPNGVQIKDGVILYKGQPIHNYVVDKIFDFKKEGLPFLPLVNFLDKLLANPSKRAVNELYSFLEHKNMPICEDGDFLAYKSVRSNYTDHHTGKFVNYVGNVLTMDRNEVCDDSDIGCSDGFHAGSYDYARSFGCANSRLIIVKINPSDVVSIPKDCDCQKLRTCRYEVVKDFDKVYNNHLNSEFGKCDSKANYHNVRDSKGRFAKKRKVVCS